MSDDTPTPGPVAVSVDDLNLPPVEDNTPIDALDASRALAEMRRKREEPAEAPQRDINPRTGPDAAHPKAAEPEPVSSKEEVAAPAEEATSAQETVTTEPTEESPIEPPRSWKSEHKESFKTLPRAVQEIVAAREQERETHLRRSQNEIAEQRKSYDAKAQQVEQARQQYEQALPALLQTMHEQQQGEFQDVKTMADVERLAREDWPRYALWDAQQKKIAAVHQEVKAAEERQKSEFTSKWAEYTTKEDAAFLEHAPEMAGEKAKDYATASVNLLTDTGFSKEDLAKMWNGQASLSLRDHRAQLIILKAAKYDAAQKAVPSKVAKVVPPVQRPGVAPQKGSDEDNHIKNLEKQLERTGNWKDAAALMAAKRSRRS